MLTGPQGQKRPAGVVGCAVMVGKIATGEIEEPEVDQAKRKAGIAGGLARSKSPDEGTAKGDCSKGGCCPVG